MLWKKGIARFALMIVAVVAVFGLFLMWQNAGDVTGFAAKKTSKAVSAKAKSAAASADPCKAAQQAYARAGCAKRLPPPQCARLSQQMNKVCPQRTPAQPVPPPPPPSAVDPTCSDTDDGKVYDVPGVISGVLRNGRAYNNPDVCKPGNIVIERYCDGTTPQNEEHPCGANANCENGACVVLCGNGRIDAGENCGTCLADAPCGADENCQNNACVAPQGGLGQSCRDGGHCDPGLLCGWNPQNSLPEQRGQTVCVPDDVPVGGACDWHFQCQEGLICDNSTGGICSPPPLPQPFVEEACESIFLSSYCDNERRHYTNKTRNRFNETTNSCMRRDWYNGPFSCESLWDTWNRQQAQGRCVAANEDYASCALCGRRACFRDIPNYPVMFSVPAEQDCAGAQDLGIVQC